MHSCLHRLMCSRKEIAGAQVVRRVKTIRPNVHIPQSIRRWHSFAVANCVTRNRPGFLHSSQITLASRQHSVGTNHCSCGLLVCLHEHCPAQHLLSWIPLDKNQLAPYQGSDWESIDNMLDLAELKSGERLLDVGCGDGRVLIRSIQRGAGYVEGWELQHEAFLLSRAHTSAALGDQGSMVHIVHGDGLLAPFHNFNVIVLYLLPVGLEKLRPALQNTFDIHKDKGIRLITQGWPIAGWKATKSTVSSGGSTFFRYDSFDAEA
jgi:2-polyprenyl-3-methyl-5-hydroxy-6-metoxy-1,4-benzoquinol methylase